jgi:hypothetical protein
MLWILVAAIVGGLLGARLASVSPWKGALMIVVGLIAVVLVHVLRKTDSELLIFAVAIITMGITGGTMSLSGREIGSVVMCGSVLGVAAMIVAGSH